MAINKIKTIALDADAVTSAKIGDNQVGVSEINVSEGTAGHVLTTDGVGGLTFTAKSVVDLSNYYTKTETDTQVSNVVDGAPSGLNTLNEIAASIGNDVDFNSTMTTALSGKAASGHTHTVAGVTDISTYYYTKTQTDTEIANLIDSAPGTLDTLNELAAALGDDPNHVTTMTNLINGLIPTGSVMMFYQAAAPTGWTQSTVHNDKALRVVNTAGGGSGGSTAFSSAWSNISHSHGYGSLSAAAHTLTIAEMPAHTHNVVNTLLADNGPSGGTAAGQTETTITTTGTGGGGSHTHSISGSTASDSMTHAPHYVDVIICSRD